MVHCKEEAIVSKDDPKNDVTLSKTYFNFFKLPQIFYQTLTFVIQVLLTSNAVDNNEYFNLGDDTTSGESGSYGPGSSPDRQSRSPPSTSDYQSDLSTNGIASGNRVIGGDSGHYSSFHSTSSFGSTSNSKGNNGVQRC